MEEFTVRCPKCGLPLFKIHQDGRQSYLKWRNGRMVQIFFKGMTDIECACGEKIDLRAQLLTKGVVEVK